MSMWLSLFPVILPTRYFLWIAALLFFICPIYPQRWELFSSLEGLYITHLLSPHNHPPTWIKGLSLVLIWKTMFFPIRGKLGYLSMTNLDSILKNKDIADKSPSSQNYGFSSGEIRMWELDHKEGWESKNWCFWIAVLEKTPESPWTARRSNQSILKEINPEYSLEGVILNLQYFGHLMWRADLWKRPWCQERLKAKREEGGRGWDG